MTAWAEQTHGPEKSGTTGKVRYRAHESSTAAEAVAAMMAQIATDYPTGPFGSWTFTTSEAVSIDSSGEWNCVGNYGPPGGTIPEPPTTATDPSYRFQVGRDRRKTLFSQMTKASYGKFGASAPDFHNMINVSDKGVEGCDLGDTSGALLFSLTKIVPNATVTDEYIADISALVWEINSETFHGFSAGRCLFVGASGSKRGAGDWEITYEFAARDHVADACANWSADSGFGSGHGLHSRAVPVGAWDYLWAFQKKEPLVIDGKTVAIYRPKYLYVEQIYLAGSFSLLGV